MKKIENIFKNKAIIIGAIGFFSILLIVVVIYSAASSSLMFFENLKNIFSCTSDQCSSIEMASSEEEEAFYKNIIKAKEELKKEGIVNPDIALFTATIVTIINHDSLFDYTKLTSVDIKNLIKSDFIAATTISCVKNTDTNNNTPSTDPNQSLNYNEGWLRPVSNIYGDIAYEVDDTTGEPISPEEENPLRKEIPCDEGKECTCPEGYTKESESTTYNQNDEQYSAYLKSYFFNFVLSESAKPKDEAEKNALYDQMIDEIYKLRNDLLEQGNVGGSTEFPFFILPVTPNGCDVTSPFGYRFDPETGKLVKHNAVDVVVWFSPREPILAVANGIVKVVHNGVPGKDYSAGCGNYVYIDHNIDGVTYQTRYCHMVNNSITVSVGDTVFQGQQIGIMGTTGYSTGIHLHFAIFSNGQFLDPTSLFTGCFGLPKNQE